MPSTAHGSDLASACSFVSLSSSTLSVRSYLGQLPLHTLPLLSGGEGLQGNCKPLNSAFKSIALSNSPHGEAEPGQPVYKYEAQNRFWGQHLTCFLAPRSEAESQLRFWKS